MLRPALHALALSATALVLTGCSAFFDVSGGFLRPLSDYQGRKGAAANLNGGVGFGDEEDGVGRIATRQAPQRVSGVFHDQPS